MVRFHTRRTKSVGSNVGVRIRTGERLSTFADGGPSYPVAPRSFGRGDLQNRRRRNVRVPASEMRHRVRSESRLRPTRSTPPFGFAGPLTGRHRCNSPPACARETGLGLVRLVTAQPRSHSSEVDRRRNGPRAKPAGESPVRRRGVTFRDREPKPAEEI